MNTEVIFLKKCKDWKVSHHDHQELYGNGEKSKLFSLPYLIAEHKEEYTVDWVVKWLQSLTRELWWSMHPIAIIHSYLHVSLNNFNSRIQNVYVESIILLEWFWPPTLLKTHMLPLKTDIIRFRLLIKICFFLQGNRMWISMFFKVFGSRNPLTTAIKY